VHWAFVKDVAAGTIQVYRDGQAFGSASTGKTIVPVFESHYSTGGAGGGLRIGELWSTYYKGALDDYRIYDRPLDAASILALYTATQTTVSIGYSAWAETVFASLEGGVTHVDAAAGADPDGDGMANLLEYALGGSPLQAESGLWPVASLVEASGEHYLQLEFTPERVEGVRYHVEVSNDLGTWTRTEITNQLITGQLFIHVDTQAVDALNSPRRFIRLFIEIE
jgi:hypothetical protein